MFTNILIIYSENELVEYLCLNTFFSLLGWFVEGKIIFDNQNAYDDLTAQEKNADIIVVLTGASNDKQAQIANDQIINVNKTEIDQCSDDSFAQYKSLWEKYVRYISSKLLETHYITDTTDRLCTRDAVRPS